MRHSTILYPVKMEYGPENNIFVLKMMMESGLKKIFWNSSMRKAFFGKSFLFHRKEDFCIKLQIQIKITLFAHGGVSIKLFMVYISTYHKWMFKLQISSIFHFDRASDNWMAHVLGVKYLALQTFDFSIPTPKVLASCITKVVKEIEQIKSGKFDVQKNQVSQYG